MFSPDIVASDAFLDMPSSTQALYFHLGMNADDDGFVSPKKIMRILGAQDDDLKVLLTKRFVLPFESGVVVIKHWLIHNLIRKDRYKETRYVDEKRLLIVKENGAYTELTTTRQPNGNQMAPQGRLGKGRLGKERKHVAAKAAKGETAKASDWTYESALEKMTADPRPDIRIIAIYYRMKGVRYDSSAQLTAAIRRDLRAAGTLKTYKPERIMKVLVWLKENADFKWTLESAHKYIDENLEVIGRAPQVVVIE